MTDQSNSAEPCRACGAAPGEPCDVVIDGQRMVGWEHDDRILAPLYRHLERKGSV